LLFAHKRGGEGEGSEGAQLSKEGAWVIRVKLGEEDKKFTW